MDVPTIIMLVSIAISGLVALAAGYFGGVLAALIISAICILGFATIPTVPFIPIWTAALIVLIEVILIAYKTAQIFGFGKGGGIAS